MPKQWRFAVLCSVALTASMAHGQSLDLLALPPIAPEAHTAPNPPENPSEPASTPISTPQSSSDFSIGVAETTLEVALKSIGTPEPDSLTIPLTLWQGSQTARLKTLLRTLSPPRNPHLRRLLRDLLLAPAALPIGSNDYSFLLIRARGLMQLGMYNETARLLEAAPVSRPEGIALANQLALRNYDLASLCPRPAQPALDATAQKLAVLCLLYANKPNEAALQTDLLSEIAPESRNDDFALLVNLLLLEEDSLPTNAHSVPQPLHLVLTRLGSITPRFAPNLFLPSEIVAMLPDQPGIPLDQRLDYAETAYRLGVIDINTVLRMQLAMQFTEAERNNAARLIAQFPSKKSRALMAQVLVDQTKVDHTELMLAALRHGDQHGYYDMMLDTLAPFLHDFKPPSPDIDWARALLALGSFKRAQQTLPTSPETPQIWLLNNVLSMINPPLTTPTALESNTDFLESLILEDDDPAQTRWQKWYDVYATHPQERDAILALLPSLDVTPPRPIPLSETDILEQLDDPTRQGEAILILTDWLSTPLNAIDPGRLGTALEGLTRLGFADIAHAYAARGLAALSRPLTS